MIAVPAALALALLGLPLLALLVRLPWSELPVQLASPVIVPALRLSLVCAVAATAVSLLLGVPLAWVLARTDLPGRRLLRALVTVPLTLPPVVGGVVVWRDSNHLSATYVRSLRDLVEQRVLPLVALSQVSLPAAPGGLLGGAEAGVDPGQPVRRVGGVGVGRDDDGTARGVDPGLPGPADPEPRLGDHAYAGRFGDPRRFVGAGVVDHDHAVGRALLGA